MFMQHAQRAPYGHLLPEVLDHHARGLWSCRGKAHRMVQALDHRKPATAAAKAQSREGLQDRKMKKPGSARQCIGNRNAGPGVMEFNCSRPARRSQRMNRSVSPFGAF